MTRVKLGEEAKEQKLSEKRRKYEIKDEKGRQVKIIARKN